MESVRRNYGCESVRKKPSQRLAHHKLPLLLTESGAKKVIAVSVCKTEGNALHEMRTFLIEICP